MIESKSPDEPKTRKCEANHAIDLDYLQRTCVVERDPLDPRDRPYPAIGRPLVRAGPPAHSKVSGPVDYTAELRPVGCQGETASCTGWAAAHLRSWLQRRADPKAKEIDFSVRWLWTSAKEVDERAPNVVFDRAATRLRYVLKVMKKHGACPDRLWPFDQVLPEPDRQTDIVWEASKYRIPDYHRLQTNEERRRQLLEHGPFLVSVPVYENWKTIGKDGLVPEPAGRHYGGHAVLVVGHDRKTGRFKFQNSWGLDWGDHGFGYFSDGYMDSCSLDSWGVVSRAPRPEK